MAVVWRSITAGGVWSDLAPIPAARAGNGGAGRRRDHQDQDSRGADHWQSHTRGSVVAIYVHGNRPAMNRRNPTLASSTLREGSDRTQTANSFIVSLRLGDGLGMQIFVPFEF